MLIQLNFSASLLALPHHRALKAPLLCKRFLTFKIPATIAVPCALAPHRIASLCRDMIARESLDTVD